jgi:hypothetical protein
MDSKNWRQNAQPPAYNAPWQVQKSSTPPQQSEGSVPPNSARPKRSYANISGVSEPLLPTKLQKLDTAVPVNSAAPSDDPPSQGSILSSRRPSRQGGPPENDSPRPPQEESQTTPVRRPFLKTRKYEKRVWTKATFQRGTIISALHYEEHIDQGHEISLNSPNGIPTSPSSATEGPSLCPFKDPRNDLVCRKQRSMVVIHTFDDHFVAVPIFSYNGKGIIEKSARKKLEHLDIHDHRTTNNEKQNNLPTLITKEMQDWCRPLVPRSAVYYTYPVSIYYRRKVAVLGELTEDSTINLINGCYRHAGRTFQPTRGQVAQRAAAAAAAATNPTSGTVAGGTPVNSIPEVEMTDQ